MKRRILQSDTENAAPENALKKRTTSAAVVIEPVAVPPFWPRQDPIPPSLARWTGNLLYWVASVGAQYYAEVVAPFGLLPSHVAVLQVLADENSLRQARLTDRTRIDRATMVGLLNELEQQGLIERRAAPHDKRAFDVFLTEKGKECVQQIEAISDAAEERFYGALSQEERQTLRALLLRLAMPDSQRDRD